MNKTLQILKNEFIITVTRRSFILTLILIPLVSLVITLFVSSANSGSSNILNQIISSNILNQIVSSPQQTAIEGFVDESGLIKLLPDWLDKTTLKAFPDQASARQALLSGAITGYYVVLKDYVPDGKVLYIRTDYNPLSNTSQTQAFDALLRYNLLNGNQSLASMVDYPLKLQTVSLEPEPQREQSNPLTFFLPYVVTMLFYIVILTAASLMLNSVTTEKQNRVIEILMVSINPSQMLAGKIIALGLVGLLQTVVWMGAGYGILLLGRTSFNLSAAFQLPPSMFIWGVVFFILGYALYASFMAGVGALVPNLREASQATTVMIIPLVIPLMLLNVLINDPNGTISTVLSLFPLTSPVTMMTRLSAGDVPVWQPFLAAAILAFTAYLVVRAVAGMFRAQTLLQGQTFSLRVFINALAGK
jgi:ABC-2 type transport system permease protein